MAETTRMPAAFFGHGSPMNALERNTYTDAWRAFGAAVPRPRAVLVVSAHWYINATAVTAMQRPRTIHDFFGFPDELFAVEYPAPGAPDIAEEVAAVARPTWIGLDHDSWGLDHGTWSVLVHAFPDADIPVLQLAINAMKPFEYHFELGAALASLRGRGIVIVGSGNIVHNLGRMDRHNPHGGYDWAERFDDTVIDVMTNDPSRIVSVTSHPDYDAAAPTADHFVPALYIAGLAAVSGERPAVVAPGCAYGSLSMTGYTFGTDGPAPGATGDVPTLAAPPVDDVDQSNM